MLGAEAAHHARVLRLAIGDAVILFDGRGRECDARLVALDAESLRCEAEPPREGATMTRRVILVQCLPKGDKIEAIVRMATELGVAEIALAHGARSVARPDAKRAEAQRERLERIAREAARQSEQASVPAITAPVALREAAARAPGAALRFALVPGAGTPLAACLARASDDAEIWLVIGPEGGLAPDEIAALDALGFALAELGSSTLRVETAAPVAVALARMVNALTP
jgi:16S rRNA (uracil1498-N3)-methyltransferase